MIDDRMAQFAKVDNVNDRDLKATKEILMEFAGSYIPFETIDVTFLKKLEMYMRTVPLKGQKKPKKKKRYSPRSA